MNIGDKTNWKGSELWMIGVDTPDGIGCCQGGCSSGTLDLMCDCERNSELREVVKRRIAQLSRMTIQVEEDQLYRWGLNLLRSRNPEVLQTAIQAISDLLDDELGGEHMARRA